MGPGLVPSSFKPLKVEFAGLVVLTNDEDYGVTILEVGFRKKNGCFGVELFSSLICAA